MRRTPIVLAVVAAALEGVLACAPEKPDTSKPTVAITATFVNGNQISEVADVSDADGVDDIVSVECVAQPGNHVAAASQGSPGVWSCDLPPLPAGTYDITMTATDKAGWTGSDVDSGESI